ncbi:hypothetical protein S1361_17605 [Streptomyces cyanogenus]|uniref:Secreted protein n=2 Tax=Streptomyces cyanogenus TaxID=80860 RepID=A0ABX7TR36_STRCY|nr:hypothetical protein S1361_17605 [Streptomyces cyanogenus]
MHMPTRTRALRFTAVLTLVVLGLTGFSGRHHGSRGSGGGGGGCSSSHQDHDSSSSSTSGGGSYDSSGGSSYGSSYGSSGGSSGGSSYRSSGGGSYRRAHRPTSTPTGSGKGKALQEGTVKLIGCATDKRPYATVEIANPNNSEAEFQARVTFYDDEGTQILDNSSYTVTVPAKGRATTRVPVGDRLRLKVDHCEARPKAEVES